MILTLLILTVNCVFEILRDQKTGRVSYEHKTCI